jgi:hypothetical protein
VHRELRRKGVTLDLLWQEYKAEHPDGYRYSGFGEHYRRWVGRLSVSMRQTHAAGEKLFIDYAGQASRGKTRHCRCASAGFTKCIPAADGGLRGHVPARPGCITPHIRFLFIAPQLWVRLPPDPASRRRPCRFPSLRLCEYLAAGLSPT